MGANESQFNYYNSKEKTPTPKYHFKCRYSPDDTYMKNDVSLFTRTKDIHRYPVPFEKVDWKVEYNEYSPVKFTNTKIQNKGGSYVDPDVDEPAYRELLFNEIDKASNCDRRSHHAPYKFIRYDFETPILVPCNPVGRTGLIGRGHLGRWGPNHAADPIVTRWKRDESGRIETDDSTGKQILQFVSIQRRDTKEWAIPGGMRDPGEVVTKTLVREFAEEALSHTLIFNEHNKIISQTEFEEKLRKFFTNGRQVYKGYVDDPRNTDNAWMETLACNFHDETSSVVGQFKLEGGDDAQSAKWMDLSSSLLLFASHKDFLRAVAVHHEAHW